MDHAVEEALRKTIKQALKEMKAQGEPIEKIIKYTGLPESQIKEL